MEGGIEAGRETAPDCSLRLKKFDRLETLVDRGADIPWTSKAYETVSSIKKRIRWC